MRNFGIHINHFEINFANFRPFWRINNSHQKRAALNVCLYWFHNANQDVFNLLIQYTAISMAKNLKWHFSDENCDIVYLNVPSFKPYQHRRHTSTVQDDDT